MDHAHGRPSARPALADWHTLGQGTLGSRIRTEILRVIAERHLEVGHRLPSERELAELLQVSRPSVREAERSLEAEGRLVIRHGQGVYVAEPRARRRLRESMAELDHNLAELFAMREVLEVPAARWAASRRDGAALTAVHSAYYALEEALHQEAVDVEELEALDARFHLRIVQAAGNRLLEQTQAVLHELMRKGMQTTLEVPGRVQQSRAEHAEILRALLAGEDAAAGEAAQAHVRLAREAANRRIAEATADPSAS